VFPTGGSTISSEEVISQSGWEPLTIEESDPQTHIGKTLTERLVVRTALDIQLPKLSQLESIFIILGAA